MSRLGRARPFPPKILRRGSVAPFSPDVTVSLTGIGMTASMGTLAVALSLAISGIAVTGSPGSVAPQTSVAPSGIAITASAGTLAPATTVGLSGAAITSSAGTVTGVSGQIVALTGISITASAGSVTPSTNISLSGAAITSGQGSVAIAGAFVPEISITLTDASNVPIPNLTGLRWAWWDTPTINSQIAPSVTGTGASTNASGVFSVTTLTGSTLTAAGQIGWIEISNSDGTTSQSPVGKVAAGPVPVS